MDNTFIKIGKVVKKEDWSRIKYHPMVFEERLVDKKKDGKVVPIENIAINELIVDIDNNKIICESTDAIYEKVNVIRFALGYGDKSPDYLIGSCVIKKEKILRQLSYDNFEKKFNQIYSKVFTENSIIYKYRQVLNSHMNLISDLISPQINNDKIAKIALIIKITYNGETKSAEKYIKCLDEIDEIFLSANYDKKRGYTFYKAFYSMFNYEKYYKKNMHTMYDDSIPYYSKDDFLSLYYARKIYNEISFRINNVYSISIFPNFDNLNIEEIEKLMFKNINDAFNFNKICDEVENIINQKVNINPKEKLIIPILLKFDVYYRYNLGNAGNQNMLRLSGIRYCQLLKIRDYINNNKYYSLIQKNDNEDKRKKSFYHILTDLYQDYNGNSDKYMKIIIHTLENIYQEKYTVPEEAIFCLLNRSEHLIRINKIDEFKNTWNYLFNIFKFLKTMENPNFVSELTSNPSYQLGVELAKFEAEWKKERENLKKTIQRFGGNISRIVFSIENIQEYYQNLVERMIRNKIEYYEHNDLLYLLNTIKNSDFDVKAFTMGYYTQKNLHLHAKKDKSETQTTENNNSETVNNHNNENNMIDNL